MVDTTTINTAARGTLPVYASALELLLSDPTRPWSEDFQIGFVPTQSVGSIEDCQVTGALSLQPDPLGAACTTATGDPWVTSAEPNPTTTMACLARLPGGGLTQQPRPVALAAARGLSVPPAADTDGAQVVATCNNGFARTGSYKVVLLIAGGDDTGSPGAPATWSSWFDPLRDAQAGSAMAIGGLVPLAAGDQCTAVPSNIETWLDAEPNVVTIDWCEVQMGNLAALTQLLDLVATLCA